MTSATAANDTTLDHSGIVYRSPTADTRETGAMDTSGDKQPTMNSAAPPSPADQWTSIAAAQQAAAPVAGTTRASTQNEAMGAGAVGRMASALKSFGSPNIATGGGYVSPDAKVVRTGQDGTTTAGKSTAGADAGTPSAPVSSPGGAAQPSIPHDNKSYTGTAPGETAPRSEPGISNNGAMPKPMVGTGQPTPGPTTEQTNAIARAQLDSMNAAERQQAQGERERGDLANTAAFAGNQAADLAARSKELGANADVNNFYAGQKGHIGAARVGRQQLTEAGNMANSATAAGRTATDIGARAATAGQQDYIAQAAARQKAAQEATQTEGAKQALPAAGEVAKQEQQKTAMGNIQLGIQSHMQALQQAAAQPGQSGEDARNSLALYNKAMKGEGGPLTEQEMAKLYSDQVTHLITSYQATPEAMHNLPSYVDFKAAMKGGATAGGPTGGAPSKLADGQYQDGSGNVYTVKGGVRTLTQANTK